MDIKVLKYFVESARKNSISKAANELNLTQPTLSRQLKDLEFELGYKLFVRTNYNIVLTKEGEILYKRACDILDLFDKTKKEFESLKAFNGGDVYIGCAETIGISKIAKVAKKLQKHNIKFHLFSGNYESVLEKLNNSLIDFAVIIQDFNVDDFSFVDLKHSDDWGILAKKSSKLSKRDFIEAWDLFNIPLIISRQGFTQELPDILRQNKDRLNVVATYDLLFNAAMFVKQGLGYALCINNLINDEQMCFIPLKPKVSSHLKLIYKNDKLSKPATIFLNELKKSLARGD